MFVQQLFGVRHTALELIAALSSTLHSGTAIQRGGTVFELCGQLGTTWVRGDDPQPAIYAGVFEMRALKQSNDAVTGLRLCQRSCVT